MYLPFSEAQGFCSHQGSRVSLIEDALVSMLQSALASLPDSSALPVGTMRICVDSTWKEMLGTPLAHSCELASPDPCPGPDLWLCAPLRGWSKLPKQTVSMQTVARRHPSLGMVLNHVHSFQAGRSPPLKNPSDTHLSTGQAQSPFGMAA